MQRVYSPFQRWENPVRPYPPPPQVTNCMKISGQALEDLNLIVEFGKPLLRGTSGVRVRMGHSPQ